MYLGFNNFLSNSSLQHRKLQIIRLNVFFNYWCGPLLAQLIPSVILMILRGLSYITSLSANITVVDWQSNLKEAYVFNNILFTWLTKRNWTENPAWSAFPSHQLALGYPRVFLIRMGRVRVTVNGYAHHTDTRNQSKCPTFFCIRF